MSAYRLLPVDWISKIPRQFVISLSLSLSLTLSLSLSLSLSQESKYHEYANIQIVNHVGIQKQYTCKMKRNDGINIIKMSISFIDAMLCFMPGGFAMYLWTSTFPDWLIDLDSNLPN